MRGKGATAHESRSGPLGQRRRRHDLSTSARLITRRALGSRAVRPYASPSAGAVPQLRWGIVAQLPWALSGGWRSGRVPAVRDIVGRVRWGGNRACARASDDNPDGELRILHEAPSAPCVCRCGPGDSHFGSPCETCSVPDRSIATDHLKCYRIQDGLAPRLCRRSSQPVRH
jgi:hypothetical protein